MRALFFFRSQRPVRLFSVSLLLWVPKRRQSNYSRPKRWKGKTKRNGKKPQKKTAKNKIGIYSRTHKLINTRNIVKQVIWLLLKSARNWLFCTWLVCASVRVLSSFLCVFCFFRVCSVLCFPFSCRLCIFHILHRFVVAVAFCLWQ